MPYSEVPAKFRAGKLHSGGPGGPVVTNSKQATAILLSEKRKAEQGKTEYQPNKLAAPRKRHRG